MKMIAYLESKKPKWVLIGEIRRETQASTVVLYEGVIQGFFSYRPFVVKFKRGQKLMYPIMKGFRFNKYGKEKFYAALRETLYYKMHKDEIDKKGKTAASKILEELREKLSDENDDEEEELEYGTPKKE